MMNRLQEELSSLRQKVEFYEKILNHSCDEIYVTDSKGITIFANPTSESHYGVPVDRLIGKSIWELEQRGIYFPAVTPMVLQKKKRITIDQETATGKILMITATPVFDDKGRIEMVICNSRDVTALEDMKRNYDEIKRKVLSIIPSNSAVRQGSGKPVIAAGSPMSDVVRTAERIAVTDSTVLLLGESGTGKDLLARYMHQLNHRRGSQFLKVNCAALPQELIESELFGYKPGAFTGASPKGKTGLFALANGGTIFLDEIAELPLTLQPKLLQVIEEQEFTPIGSDKVEKVDVRIIASTNRDLAAMIEEGRFREDLYYRLCVITVGIPPLRKRKEDIPRLIEHYLEIYADRFKRRIEINPEARVLLMAYDWPGNVRELKHLMEHLFVIVPEQVVGPEQLPPHINVSRGKRGGKTLPEMLDTAERELILESYRQWGSSYKVACHLGISQSSAARKIRKHLKGTVL